MIRSGLPATRRSFLKAAVTATMLPLGAQSRGQDSSRKPDGARFSLAHLTVLGCAPPEMTYIAARAGYDYVSYRLVTMHLPDEPVYDLTGNRTMFQQTRKALAETGLKLHDVELARIQDGIDVKSYLPALEIAAELGAHHVITSVWTANPNYALDRLSTLCDAGKKLDLTMNLEFVTWANVANLREALAVCHSVKRDNLGLLIDVLHFNRSRVLITELNSVPKEWFHFAHVCDAPKEIPATTADLVRAGREERLYAGEGAIDIAGILNRLPLVPYSLEIPHLARVKELGYAEHAWRCLEAQKLFLCSPSGVRGRYVARVSLITA